jgi:glycerophosphoryl diester phosphodiesterase
VTVQLVGQIVVYHDDLEDRRALIHYVQDDGTLDLVLYVDRDFVFKSHVPEGRAPQHWSWMA